jgi:hypothetical protein
MTHGLYTARLLSAEERTLVGEWQECLVSLQAQFPGEGDRIDLLVIDWLFLYRAIRADHIRAIQRAGQAIRTHLNMLRRPKTTAQSRRPSAHEELDDPHAWERMLVAEIETRPKTARILSAGV